MPVMLNFSVKANYRRVPARASSPSSFSAAGANFMAREMLEISVGVVSILAL
jgi:hypothetical protein